MPRHDDRLVSTTRPTLNDPDGESVVVSIDVDRLVKTRLLAQANSGAGKSWLLRRLLEATYGKVQHVVIDVEGEFHTLRETFDYVLASPTGGDCVANLTSAKLLARRILELGVSIIIDIYELGAQQAKFVQLFLESLMSAPRDLWHPVLVVVDEAHKFCPEKADSVAAPAVIDLMTRGRKRGFSGLLATQRLSKLDKDAAAEANNLLIGRTALDLDITRAASVLGMTMKDARAILPKLGDGDFYAVGPALSPTVERIHIGHVQTSHPEAGTRGAAPTPPRDTVRAVLAKLADLPAEAEAEDQTVAQLRAKIRELVEERDQLSRAVNSTDPNDRLRRVNREMQECVEQQSIKLTEARRFEQAQSEILDAVVNGLDAEITRLTDLRNMVPDKLSDAVEHHLSDKRVAELEKPLIEHAQAIGGYPRDRDAKVVQGEWMLESSVVTNDPNKMDRITFGRGERIGRDVLRQDMPAMHRAFLTALAQYGALPKRKLLIYTGYARGGATSKCFAELTRNGWVRSTDDGGLVITDAGSTALGNYEPLPRGLKLRVKIEHELAAMEREIFSVVCAAYPEPVAKHDILEKTGYSRGGATSKAFAYLVGRDYLVADGPGRLRAAKELFS